MNSRARDQEEFEFLSATGRDARARRVENFLHLDQPVGIWNCIRIANEIARSIPPGRLVDWSCGFGQITYGMLCSIPGLNQLAVV